MNEGSARRTALVTGASRGIGAAIAERLAEAGMHVVMVARDPAALGCVEHRILARGQSCAAYVGDILDLDSMVRLRNALGRQGLVIDVLVNNAGVAARKNLVELSGSELDWLVGTNVFGTLQVTQLFWPDLCARSGTLVFLSSLAVQRRPPGFEVYAATKAFIDVLANGLASEGRKSGVRVYCVAPGFVDTALRERVSPEVDPAVCLAPASVAAVVADLCDPACPVAPGEVIRLVK